MPTYVDATGITVDGVPLNTVAKAVETKTGRMKVAGARAGNKPVAGRSGRVWTPGKPSDEGRIILPMYVLGCDDDGAIPGGSSALKEFYKNKDLLQRIFSKRHALLDLLQTQADATVRQAYAEVTAEIDFEMFNEADARVTYELVIPSVFWRDNADITQVTSGLTANGAVSMTSFSGATAPMEDAGFLVDVTSGTLTNPRLVDMVTGSYVQYNGTLTAGGSSQRWYVDSSVWASRLGNSSMAMSPTAGTNIIGSTIRSGLGSRLLAVVPWANATTGTSDVNLQGTWSGTASVTVKGRRKYHS